MANRMDTNNDGLVSLREYLLCEPSADTDKVIVPLSEKMEVIHRNNYYIEKLDSDHIVMETHTADQVTFGYTNLVPMTDREIGIPSNIEEFAKLSMGAKLSSTTGFSDYTRLPTEYIRSELPNIVTTLDVMGENSDYYANVFGTRDRTRYYHNQIKDKQQESGNSMGESSLGARVKVKSTAAGKAFAIKDEAALINILFYPILIISAAIVFVIIHNCIQYFI
jgi:hypothetical protein